MPLVDCQRFSDSAPDEPTMDVQNPEGFLKNLYVTGYVFGRDDTMRTGYYRIHGWSYNYRPWLQRFWVRQHNQISEYWAPDTETLLKLLNDYADMPYDRVQEYVLMPAKDE